MSSNKITADCFNLTSCTSCITFTSVKYSLSVQKHFPDLCDGCLAETNTRRITSEGISWKTAMASLRTLTSSYIVCGSAETGGRGLFLQVQMSGWDNSERGCKVEAVKVKSWSSVMLCSLSACSALCIPAPRRSIWRLSVKVVSNSNHHKRWEQTEKTTAADIPEIFLPSALHLRGKMLLHALGLVRKSTQVLCHTGA